MSLAALSIFQSSDSHQEQYLGPFNSMSSRQLDTHREYPMGFRMNKLGHYYVVE